MISDVEMMKRIRALLIRWNQKTGKTHTMNELVQLILERGLSVINVEDEEKQ